jgi:potassium/hydrogen antiporter
MAVGLVAGAARAAGYCCRSCAGVPLPNEGLYTLRVLAGTLAIYGLATIAHVSGFLAVFIAGIVLGDEHAPYKGEIAHFHSALASLAEIVAFVMLGLCCGRSGCGAAGQRPAGRHRPRREPPQQRR